MKRQPIAVYKDSDFVSYKDYKFMKDYEKEFLPYNDRRIRNRRKNCIGRVSRSFRMRKPHRIETKMERLGKYLIFTDDEKDFLKEKEREELELLKEKKLGEIEKVVEYECPICMESSEENKSQMIHLECGHSFHECCLSEWIKRIPNGKGERFGTTQARCPMCRRFIWTKNNKEINQRIWKIEKKSQLIRSVLLDKSDVLEETHLEILKKNKMRQVNQVMDKYVFYTCYDCESLYFGGQQDCIQDLQEVEEEVEEEEKRKQQQQQRTCHKCFVKRNNRKNFPSNCEIHGDKYIAYKCRFCCNLADFFCFGTTHFCSRCHLPVDFKVYECPGEPECSGHHVPNGTGEENEQCLGCTVCRVAGGKMKE